MEKNSVIICTYVYDMSIYNYYLLRSAIKRKLIEKHVNLMTFKPYLQPTLFIPND